MHLDPNHEICVCNGIKLQELKDFIKKKNITTLQELLENEEMPVGDKCEACRDEGFENDGINLPLVLAMVRQELQS